MKAKRAILSVLSAVLVMCMALFAMTACSPTTVTISQTSASIIIGENLSLTATASDEAEITWSTSDEDVATVSRNGTVRGVGEGTATITAATEDASATCTVTVSAVTVTISPETASVERGETVQLSATASDDGTITWSSSDTSIATVSSTGLVTGVAEGTATITARRGSAGSDTCTVTVTWEGRPDDYAEIEAGDEAGAVANPGTWIYWADQGWVSTTVSVSEAYYADGAAHFTYSNNNGEWFGFQIFYQEPGNVIGTTYLAETTVVSEEAGDITVNGEVFSLKEGSNDVQVVYTESQTNSNGTAAASVSIQMGVNGVGPTITANTISISDFTFEPYTQETLATPTALSITEAGVVTVTDSNEAGRVSGYTLQFCQNGSIVYTQTVENGGTIDDSAFVDGTYDVRVIAVAASSLYASSAVSGNLATYIVENGGVVYDVPEGGATDAVANAGKFYYWTEWAGGISNATYNKGTLQFSVDSTGGNWYSQQIFYRDSAVAAGETYTLSMTLTSPGAGSITVGGKVFNLTQGANNIVVENLVQGGGADAATISIQFGVNGTGTAGIVGTVTITNINIAVA